MQRRILAIRVVPLLVASALALVALALLAVQAQASTQTSSGPTGSPLPVIAGVIGVTIAAVWLLRPARSDKAAPPAPPDAGGSPPAETSTPGDRDP